MNKSASKNIFSCVEGCVNNAILAICIVKNSFRKIMTCYASDNCSVLIEYRGIADNLREYLLEVEKIV